MIYSKLSSDFEAHIESGKSIFKTTVQNQCWLPSNTRNISELELASLFGALPRSIDSVCTQYCDNEHDSSNDTSNCSHTNDANEQLCGKVHGIGNYAFVVDDSMPGGSNILIEILKQVLLCICKSAFYSYLQVDNGGENKNKTMFSFQNLAELVFPSIFSKVNWGRLFNSGTHPPFF